MYKQWQAIRDEDGEGAGGNSSSSSTCTLTGDTMTREERFASWSRKRKTLAFSCVGTPDYMAPEILVRLYFDFDFDFFDFDLFDFDLCV